MKLTSNLFSPFFSYLAIAVNELFQTLLAQGHAKFGDHDPWYADADFMQRYGAFRGNFHKAPGGQSYDFFTEKQPAGDFAIRMRMTPGLTKPGGTSAGFFDKEEYAKRLIGLAFSVPVVERFLKPLQHIFLRQEYEGYTNAPFKWETPPSN